MDKYQVIQSPYLANSNLEGCAVLITIHCTKTAENVSQSSCRNKLSGCLKPAPAAGLGLRWPGLFCWSLGRARAVSLGVKAHPARTPLPRPHSLFSCLLPTKRCNDSGKLPGQRRRLEILHLPALISFLPCNRNLNNESINVLKCQ